MAPDVHVTGSGTYGVGAHIFRPGLTACDDEEVLAVVRADDLPWVNVIAEPQPDRAPPTPAQTPELVPVPDHVPVSETPAIAEAAALFHAAIANNEPEPAIPTPAQAEIATSDQPPEPEPPKVEGFPCDQCDKVLASEAGRQAHVRSKHADANA